MLVIRKEQMAALSGCARLDFERRMVAHIERCWRERSRLLGVQAVLESVRQAVERCTRYGITLEYDVARFIDLMYALDLDFDTSPRWPWAAPIVRDQHLDGHAKVDRLWRAAWYELEARRIAHGR